MEKDENGQGLDYGSEGNLLSRCKNCLGYFNTYCDSSNGRGFLCPQWTRTEMSCRRQSRRTHRRTFHTLFSSPKPTICRSKLRLARTSSKTLFSSRVLRPTHFCQEMLCFCFVYLFFLCTCWNFGGTKHDLHMVGDLRMWDDDYVDELCDIVFGEFLAGNFAQGVPRDPVWDVIT
ncbi:hypothetical protein CMV_012867 [Castanea mollissima]|uniref:Uncharacterized protein n=1 Tax=Castanea mollissima TaxID=60419 RepID=A0A8J4R131_9ROSI|nr:hypothetical protein CMV_012867 [Castanea mollissima]